MVQLAEKINRLVSQLENAPAELQDQFSEFLTSAKHEVSHIQGDLKEIDHMRLELAEYFAEDPKTFKLEECFAIMRWISS